MLIQPWYYFDEMGKQPCDSHKSHQTQVHRWTSAVYEEARTELDRNEEIISIDKYVRYLMGHHWPERRPSYKSSPVDNKIWTNLVQLVSYLTDIRQSFEIQTGNPDLKGIATTINMLARSWFINQDVDITTAMIVIYSALTVGYGRQVYNEDANGGEGEIELSECGPLDLIPIKPGKRLEDALGVIYEKPMPLTWFQEKYPILGDLVPADPQYSTYRGRETQQNSQWHFLAAPFRRLFGMEQHPSLDSAIPMGRYREFYLKDNRRNTSDREVFVGDITKQNGYMVPPGGKLYPRKRLIIMGGPVVLYDGPNPFWHGRYPFAAMRINQVPWQWPGVSEFRNQIPLQDVLNAILAGVLDVIKKAVNPVMTAPINAFSDAVRRTMDPNMPGARLYYNQAAGQPPKWEQPPMLPPYVMDGYNVAREALTSQTGFIDANTLANKRIIPAQDTIEEMKGGQQTVVRLKVRFIESFFREVGEQYISNVFQFAPAARRLQVLGRNGLFWTDYNYEGPASLLRNGQKPEDAWRSYKWTVAPGTLVKGSNQEERATAIRLRSTGDLDRRNMFKILDLENIVDSVERNLRREGADILLNMLRTQLSQQGGGAGMQISPDLLNQITMASAEKPEPIQ